ncbi:AraC family transcriptional regulator [Bacillaceae bacterium SIJ1]|nr:AraC family transcriptional regulator [Litoribacterium kuwaitense]
MLTIKSVHFDDFIPNWLTRKEHIDYHILIFVTKGKNIYEIEDQLHTASEGEIIFFPKNTFRAGYNHPSGPHQKYAILFEVNMDTMKQIPFLEKETFVHHKVHHFQFFHRAFEKIYKESQNNAPFSSHICLGVFIELIGKIAREIEKPEVVPIKAQYVDKIRRFLLEHYREAIQTEELAKLIQRSPNYTSTLFREVVGQTPIQYMHQLRVKEACSLLANSDMTIANISFYLGYYDTSYFFRMFKKHIGVSPSEYARNVTKYLE